MPKALKIPVLTSDPAINLALDTIANKKQALVFANTKRSAEKLAEELSKKVNAEANGLSGLADNVLNVLSRPTKQCERLARCVKKGIAFHHSGLPQKQRELVEGNFRSSLLKVICCTPTLAFGLNLPAFRVIIRDLKRYGARGYNYIPVLEYLQFAGRAGRPQWHDKFGEAIIIAASNSEKDKLYEKYILGEPEEIYSKLAVEPSLRMYTLSLIATGYALTRHDIFAFFGKTFFAFQFKDTTRIEMLITRILGLLDGWELITSSTRQDFQDASELGNESYNATILGRRVAELYLDPLTSHHLVTCIRRAKDPTAFALLQMISNTIEMRPLLSVKVKEMDIVQEYLIAHNSELLEHEPSVYDIEYEDFLNSIKTALFLNDWVEEKDEESLLEAYNIRPGEIRVKLDIADWLLYASSELARILKLQPMIKEITKLRLRLKYGAKEELLPLLQLKDIGRVRARLLFRNGIKDIAAVKKADMTTLVQILGSKVAQNIKEQVGQKLEAVPDTKRKGQLGLGKYSN